MNKAFCRIYQFAMKIGNYFIGYRSPELIEGAGAIKKLPAIIKEKGFNRLLVVTDAGLIKLGLPDAMLAAMKDEGLIFEVFSDISGNPTSMNVEDGYSLFRDNRCEAIVAFGGGAPMDCAKAIAAKAVHPKKTATEMQGLLKVGRKTPTVFAVPTTAGTGSETTLAAVITDSYTHHKASINDPALIPSYAVLDPELTVGLPPFVTAATGMDALCHAVEAFTNSTYNTRLENKLAKEAVLLIYNNLLSAYKDGTNMDARRNMQLASFYAGRAFTRGCVGYVHAVGHTLGGLYGMAHGQAMAIILPHVMRKFGSAVYERLARLAEVCGMNGEDDKEKALRFISWIEELKAEMSIPEKTDVIKKADILQMIKWALAEANPLYPVPVVWGEKEFSELIEEIRA